MAEPAPALVTIGHAYGQMEAALAASILETNGIPAMVDTRQMGSVSWHSMILIGGMPIRVPASDAEAAHELLDDFRPVRPRAGVWMILFFIFAFLWSAVPPPASGYFPTRLQPASRPAA